MTAALRVGIVGLGWIGRDHLADLASRPGVEISAVCDVDTASSSAVAESSGAAAFSDPAKMYEAVHLDAVWVCTPPQVHADATVAAFKYGIPVYLEKPIARTLKDAQRICQAADRAGAICAVGYQWHSLELIDALREQLAGQRVAALIGQSIGTTAARPWFLKSAASGGNLLERGSHHLDLARTIGGPVTDIQVTASRVQLVREQDQAMDRDIEDTLTILLRFDGGATATIVVAWSHPGGPSYYGMDVIADRGAYRLTLDPAFTMTGVSGGRLVSVSATPAFRRSNDRFIAAVAAADPAAVPCNPADAADTLALALAGERSLASGQWVKVQ